MRGPVETTGKKGREFIQTGEENLGNNGIGRYFYHNAD